MNRDCQHDEILQNFETLGETFTCSSCGGVYKVCYDEVYSDEDGEDGWFWLEEVSI